MNSDRKRYELAVATAGGLGSLLMLVFDTTLSRVAGVTLFLCFIVGGLLLIVDVGFLERDRDDEPKGGPG